MAGGFGHHTLGFGSMFNRFPELPAGLIVPYLGNAAPANWSIYAPWASSQVYLQGTNYVAADYSALGTHLEFTTTTTNGAHTGSNTGNNTNLVHSPSGSLTRYGGNASAGGHNHDVSFLLDIVPPYKNYQLIKLGTAGLTQMPINGMVLSSAGALGALAELAAGVNAFMRFDIAANRGLTGGSNALSATQFTDYAGDHDHGTLYTKCLATASAANYMRLAGGHQHAITVNGTLNLKYANVSGWGNAASTYSLVPGAIAFWETVSIPAGWALCDGSLGTPDLSDHYFRLVSSGGEGFNAGSSTTMIGTTNSAGHGHVEATVAATFSARSMNNSHSNTVNHSHTVSFTCTPLPRTYKLLPIIYLG